MSMPYRSLRVLVILAYLAGLFLLVAGTFKAFAHHAPTGWEYPLNCCSGMDCHEINAATVHETPEGYVLTLQPSDHMMLAQPTSFIVPYSDARIKDSPDGVYHACISRQTVVNGSPMGGRLICLFAPPKGF